MALPTPIGAFAPTALRKSAMECFAPPGLDRNWALYPRLTPWARARTSAHNLRGESPLQGHLLTLNLKVTAITARGRGEQLERNDQSGGYELDSAS